MPPRRVLSAPRTPASSDTEKPFPSCFPGLLGIQAVLRELGELVGTKERSLAALSADGESQYSKVPPVLNTSASEVATLTAVEAPRHLCNLY